MAGRPAGPGKPSGVIQPGCQGGRRGSPAAAALFIPRVSGVTLAGSPLAAPCRFLRGQDCGSVLSGCPALGHDVVDRGSPVGLTVPGPAAGRVRQREQRPGAVRELDVLVSEVDPPAGDWNEESPAVVTPAGAGPAREALVLAEAVLRGPAHSRDVDHGVEQA